MSQIAGTALVSGLRTRPDTALAKLKPYRPILAGIYNWVWIVAALVLGQKSGWNILTIPAAMIVIGIHLHRNAILGHDGAHFLITKHRFLNDLFVNLLFFWPVFATVSGYRDWHMNHHRWQGTDKDPENEVKTGSRYQLPKTKSQLIGECLLDLVGYGVNEVLRLLWVIRPKRNVEMLGPLIWWGVVGGLLILTGNLYVIPIFVAALLTTFWSIFRLRGWFEHQGIKGTHRFSAGPLIRYIYFPHNTWCHYEHHKWPQLPYYALPAARKLDVETEIKGFSEVFMMFEQSGRS